MEHTKISEHFDILTWIPNVHDLAHNGTLTNVIINH